MENQQQPVRRQQNFGTIFYRVCQIAQAVLSLVVILLITRVVLSFLGALETNDFVAFIYGITTPLVEPFRGMFNVPEFQLGGSRLEYEAYVAILVYTLAGAGVTAAERAIH